MFTTTPLTDNDREEGFTLVELLVVILIIGILAAIAIPMYLNQRKAAVDATVESDVKNTATQIESLSIEEPRLELTKEAVLAAMANHGMELHFSDGNNWNILGSTNDGYCLTGWNPDGARYIEGSVATWDSKAGGLNRTGGACPAGLVIDGPPSGGDAAAEGDETQAYSYATSVRPINSNDGWPENFDFTQVSAGDEVYVQLALTHDATAMDEHYQWGRDTYARQTQLTAPSRGVDTSGHVIESAGDNIKIGYYFRWTLTQDDIDDIHDGGAVYLGAVTGPALNGEAFNVPVKIEVS